MLNSSQYLCFEMSWQKVVSLKYSHEASVTWLIYVHSTYRDFDKKTKTFKYF